MLWPHDLKASGLGNSSGALVELAPEVDPDASAPVERNLQQYRSAALTPPKPSDAPHPKQCPICGMLPVAFSLPHCTPVDCIQDLRSRLGEKELRSHKKKRAATVG